MYYDCVDEGRKDTEKPYEISSDSAHRDSHRQYYPLGTSASWVG
jgi:hypothetical protein